MRGAYFSSHRNASRVSGVKFTGLDDEAYIWMGHDEESTAEIPKLLVPPFRP
jgi:hypothetical protein